MKKEIGLLIYMMGVLLIASPKRFGFKEDVYPSYHHEVFDKDSIRQKLLRLEKQMTSGIISKKDDEGLLTVTKLKRDWRFYAKSRMLELKYSLKPMPNFRSHEDVNAYIRKRTLAILNKYYNMEESDFYVNFEGRIKMVGEKKVVAADWVYKKYGILNPRPTFIRTRDEFGVEMYAIECPPEWEDVVSIDGQQYWDGAGRIKSGDLVIFAPLDFGNITIKERVPIYVKLAEPVLITGITGLSLLLSIFITPEAAFSPLLIGMAGRASPLSGNIKLEQLNEILNVWDHGIVEGTDVTNALETFFSGYGSGRTCFFPFGSYNVDQYGARIAGAYSDVIGPQILVDTTIVGEGDGTEFVAQANALYMFLLNGDNITVEDVKFTGTGAAGGGNLSSGPFYGQNIDNLQIINVTSNNMIGGGGINSRGISIVGDQTGSLVQDCRMDGNQHGIVVGAPNACHGVRLISNYSNDAVEKNFYNEGNMDGLRITSCVSDGTGSGCYTYHGATHKGTTVGGNTFLSDGPGLEPYQPTVYTHFNDVWSENIAQGGTYGSYPQCAMTIFKGNILTFSDGAGMYSFVRFTYNMVSDNVISKNTSHGIHIRNDSDNNEYRGNLIIDNYGLRGIYLQEGTNNRFIGNKIYSSDTATYHTSSGISINDDYNYLRDNDLKHAGLYNYGDSVTTTIWASGNLTMAFG